MSSWKFDFIIATLAALVVMAVGVELIARLRDRTTTYNMEWPTFAAIGLFALVAGVLQ